MTSRPSCGFARHAVTCDSLRDALAPVAEVEVADDTLRAYVSQLRRLLRSTFNLPESADPLPAVRSGTVRGWKLADELLRWVAPRCAKNLLALRLAQRSSSRLCFRGHNDHGG